MEKNQDSLFMSNTVSSIYDQVGQGWQNFNWDAAGNMVYHENADGCGRTLCWDEENRLMSFADCENTGFYQYDAGRKRTYKLASDYETQNIGGQWYIYQVLDNPTLYTSPYLVVTSKGYMKHYYAESERGSIRNEETGIRNCSCAPETVPLGEELNLFTRTKTAPAVHSSLLIPNSSLHHHPDHLGSSSWITYTDGEAIQHLHYLPWGEDMVNQQLTGFGSMYTFSAKEKDAETGYSYFGARYYSSELSIWLSVDPMADKYPSLSPYTYCANNPIKLVDPNGEEIWINDGGINYKYANGKQYTQSGDEYTAKEGTFAHKLVTSLNQIKDGGDVGNAMISELESTTSYSVNISDAGEGKSTYNNGTIRWNTHGQKVPTTAGLRANALMGLAHELSHAVDDKRGTLNTEKTKENCWIGDHEWKAVYTENQIRKEQDIPLRTHYEIDMSNPMSPKGTGPEMIDKINKTTVLRLPKDVSPLYK